jgi:secreted trypsin-like serine protease
MEVGRIRRVSVVVTAALVAALLFVFVPLQSGEPVQATEAPANSTKIIGGKEVPGGKYRFIAALRSTTFGSTAYQQQYCGGTLIDRNSVLTAAHCVTGSDAPPRWAMRVTVGRTVLNSTQGQTRAVSAIFVHPNNYSNDAYDAAVLKLGSPVWGIASIKLAKASQNRLETPGRYATVAGWGNTTAQPAGGSSGSSYPYQMREAQVPIVSDNTAASIYGSSFVKSINVAAGRTGKDTCQGDSGGPLFVKPSGTYYTQIGVTSRGVGCGVGFPGVYTEVNAFPIRNFIINAASR